MAREMLPRRIFASLLLCSLGGSEALRVGFAAPSAVAVRAAAPAMLAPQEAQPLANMVLVELAKEPAQSAGGILMPTAFSDDPSNMIDVFKTKEVKYGKVLGVGPGRVSEDGSATPSIDFSVGEQVLVAPVDGIKVEPDGPSQVTAVFLFRVDQVWATSS